DDPVKNKPAFDKYVTGMRQDAIDAISAIEPYKRGKGHQLWVLHRLNNIDKHRLLLAVGSLYRSINLGAYLHPGMQNVMALVGDQWHDLTGIPDHPLLDHRIDVEPRMFPSKAGDVLFTGLPDAEVNSGARFDFDVVINELQIVEGEPLLKTVRDLANLVDDVV